MSLVLKSFVSAIAPKRKASFQAYGGEAPYTYEVVTGGAGGTINASTGLYTSPSVLPLSPDDSVDIISVTDSLGATAVKQIMVCGPLLLVCDIIRAGLGLTPSQVYLYNQKIFLPRDKTLAVAVGVINERTVGYVKKFNETTMKSEQSVSKFAHLSLDVISLNTKALYVKDELSLALNSDYSQNQQVLNSFRLSNLTVDDGIDLSSIAGPAIPYRFRMKANLIYSYGKDTSVDYFDDFDAPTIEANA